MQSVAICFSGHPRVILSHVSSWEPYFSLIRRHYDLHIYFHCWAQQGLVALSGGRPIEGELIPGFYQKFQELISYLEPKAFSIESLSPELLHKCIDFPSVFLSSWQAGRNKILSQLYSIDRADTLRQSFEALNEINANVVIRMRFDAIPQNLTLNEIRYVADNPNVNVLFAPSPMSHRHPGGGGGCCECHAFFDEYWLTNGFAARSVEFLSRHPRHSNDICDLFAVGNPIVMRQYARIFHDAYHLNRQIIVEMDQEILKDYALVPDKDEHQDSRISATTLYPWDIERSPIFVPEKLIRLQMAGSLVVHGETVIGLYRD